MTEPPLTAVELAASDDQDLVTHLLAFLYGPDVDRSQLEPGQAAVVSAMLCSSDVSNGGLGQFLGNWGAAQALTSAGALHFLGALEHERLLVQALKRWADIIESCRIDGLFAHDDDFDDLNDAWFSLDSIEATIASYARANPREFLAKAT